MPKIMFLLVVFFTVAGFAATQDIVFPDPVLSVRDGSTTAAVQGCIQNGIGVKPVLPLCRLSFSSAVQRVEVLESMVIPLSAPIKKGRDLYRIEPAQVTKVTLPGSLYILPTAHRFYEMETPGFMKGRPVHDLVVYPLVDVTKKQLTFIKKIRIHLAGTKPLLYLAGTEPQKRLLILTTDAITTASKELTRFVEAKQSAGFTVSVATEAKYGAIDLTGRSRVLKIREWLKTVASEYDFLLIIGDPTPESGSIPMLRSLINNEEAETQYHDVPTDFIYAELDGNWDSNGNGVYGEANDKGVNFNYDLIVGRIPVWGGQTKMLDKILARTIAFMQESPAAATYRRNMLFPATIAYYENQDGQSGMPKMDGAYIVEYFKTTGNFKDYALTTMVEQEGVGKSEFKDAPAVSQTALLAEWKKGYGLVFWMGHGLPTLTVRTIWRTDKNGNGYADSYELDSSTLITSNDTQTLADAKPAFVYMGSCLNGDVDYSNNLGYMMLENSAIGTVAASQVSYGSIFDNYDPMSSQDVFSYGAAFSTAVAKNQYPARELAEAKRTWQSYSVLKTMKLELNYFGDPTLTIGLKQCTSDEQCDDGLFCNGTEACMKDGYCGVSEPAPQCSSASTGDCSVSYCDEASKSCAVANKEDGTACKFGENKCYKRYACQSGECVAENLLDCSSLDAICSKGVCNPGNGICESEPANEGTACDDGQYCTVDSVCVLGQCSGKPRTCSETASCKAFTCDELTQSCQAIQDLSQNGTACATAEGLAGTCDYGTCEALPEPPKKDDAKGCSLTLL